jgi:hypothetical protein
MAAPTPAQKLFLANVEKVEMACVRAVAAGVADPVVVVMDLRDEVARSIVAVLGEHGAAIERIRAPDEGEPIPTALSVVPFARVDADVIPSPEGLEEFRKGAPAGNFGTLVFARGVLAGFYRPIPE